MKKKKKIFIEKKAQIKEAQAETQQLVTSSTTVLSSTATKRTNKGIGKKPEIDAKEAAKKLIQSGAIKLETENKSKGFKRSCSRKDDIKKSTSTLSTNLESQFSATNQQITYSSINSPNNANTKSPNAFTGSPNYSNTKLSYSTSGDTNQFGQSPNYNRHYRRMNSFSNDVPSQGPTPGNGMPNIPNFRFQKRPNQHFNNNNNNNFQQKNGISLFIKANNVSEELLRSIFSANVSQVKVLSIDVKTNFAFVSVETKEAADIAITELNGKTFQENLFSVSIARPRKQFQRNNTYNPGGSNYSHNNNNYGSKSQFDSGGPNNFNNNNNNDRNTYSSNNTFNNNSNYDKAGNANNNPSNSAPSGNTNETSSENNSTPNRQMINYDDI